MDKKQLRAIFNALFLLGALATIIIFFAIGKGPLFYGVGIVSLILKATDYIIRFFL